MPKAMMVPKTFRLPKDTADLIERMAAEQGIPQHVIVSRSVWYLATLPDRLKEALSAEIMPIVIDLITKQNEEFKAMLREQDRRISEMLSDRKL